MTRILQTTCFLLVAAISLFSWSCVDAPSQGQLPPDYHALARFINVASDAPGGAVTVDGATVANLANGGTTGYLDFPAGGRTVGFASVAQSVTLRSNSQNTIVIYPLRGSNRILGLDEGYSFQDPFSGGSGNAQIMFVNVATGSFPTLALKKDSLTGTIVNASLPFAVGQGYTNIAAGTQTFFVTSDGGYKTTIAGSNSIPAVVTRTTGNGTFGIVFGSGSLAYTITLHSDVKDSLYTAAHFHFGDAASNGPVAMPIDITAQKISFPDVVLNGAAEVPSDSAQSASGTGSFVLTRDGLVYTVTVHGGHGLDSTFVAGHFHNAVPGVSGPVVRTIATGAFSDTVFSGVWTSSDAQPLTPALITELLAGRIYVNFHTPAHPSGAIRAQLIPDSISDNTFSGSWDDMSDADIDSLVAGQVYVNFHDTKNPGGRVRGQLVIDSTNGGHYGSGSLPPTDFIAGKLYTVLVTGAGKSLNMTVYPDRQHGVPKLGQTATQNPK